ncbi:hypothetical protein [Mycoplasmoides pirum]|uniref:hypothetical protein n=1 Tax=Mycoplasmoides pirum TaxID=2122 RepID=UPI000AE528B9|nr:hypothetical protein [Mycoplasmoides pirum]
MKNQVYKVPKNKSELLKQYYKYVCSILKNSSYKYRYRPVLFEKEDLNTIAYLFLIKIWKRALARKDIINFKCYLFISVINEFKYCIKKYSLPCENQISFNEKVHTISSNNSPDKYVKYIQYIDSFKEFCKNLNSNEAEAIFEILKCKNKIEEIAIEKKLKPYQLRYLWNKSKNFAKGINN